MAIGIVQDDKDDWERESARMADIYSQSCLSIAATCASSCDEGLGRLRERPEPLVLDFEDVDGPYRLFFDQQSRGIDRADDFIKQVSGAQSLTLRETVLIIA